MKLKYQNSKIIGKTVSFGVEVENGTVHDFSSFGADQRHFELKALGTKEWVRLSDDGSDIEDAVIIEPKRRGRPPKHGNA